ncbi:recombination-associated protein RdgC [Utexia brackfieldae]|uniref:recombination-associated protein RdgC n=1 Tax=Utexia brackfieldae TaxID=3074108 RepID=UPI00370D6D43
MLWFKNAIVYQFSKETILTKEALETALKSMQFIPCGSQDMSKFGWVSPCLNDNLVLEMQGQFLLKAKKETKMLPSSVVKQALQVKIDHLEQTQQRKLKKIEKETLKEEVLIDLLPRAFSKYNHYWLWIDTKSQRVIVDSASYKQAEDLLALLRKCLGSLPLIPLDSEIPLEQLLTKWVKENQSLPPFILGDEAELKDPLDGNGIIRCKQQELTSAEIIMHIDAGKQVTKLKLIEEAYVNFILQSDMTIKRLKYDASLLDKNEDIDRADIEKRLEADFLVISDVLRDTIEHLIKAIDILNRK